MRAFVAVDAPASAFLAKLQAELLEVGGWTGKDVKPVEAQNFHFTLIFLGEVTEEQVQHICSALSSVWFERFSIEYSRVGAFPVADSARVIWAGINPEGGSRLDALARQVVSKVTELGFRQDKPFSPHLTLLRARDRPLRAASALNKIQSSMSSTQASLSQKPYVIDKVHLKKSDLRPAGPVYSNVYTVDAAPAL